MKKKFIVPVLALALGTSSLAGCVKKSNPQPTPSGKSLSSIAITAQPTVTTYEFDVVSVSLEGMEVTAYFSDQTSQVLQSSEYQTTSLEPTAIQKASGSFTVTVSYTYNSVKKSAPVNFTINPAPQADWKDEEITLMEQHLLGKKLPFIDLGEGYTVEYANDAITIEGSEGFTIDQDGLLAYARKFLNAGWSCTATGETGAKYYQFNMTVERQDDAPAVITGYFGAVSGQTPVASGAFLLEVTVQTPYYKDWPADKVADLVKDWSSSTTNVVPSFEASYYGVQPMSSSSYGMVIGFGVEEDPTTAYEAKLTDWTLDKTSYSYPYALSPDESFGIFYTYVASAKQFAVMVIEARKKSAEWPTENVNSLVAPYAHGDTAPTFSGEPAQNVSEYSINSNVVILKVAEGKETEVINAFVSQATGYDQSVYDYWHDGTITLVSPNKNIMIWIWQQKAGQVNIQFEPFKIADTLAAAGVTDALPAGVEKTSVEDGYDNEYSCYELKQASSEAVTAKIAEFQAAALAAGYLPHTIGTSTFFFSPNQQLMIKFAAYQSFVDVYIYYGATPAYYAYPVSEDEEHTPVFPSSAIASFLGADHAAVPALAGAAAYLIPGAGSSYPVYARFASEEAATSALATYVESLATDYNLVSEGVYASKDSTTGITVSRIGCYVALFVEDIAVFPLAGINAFLDESFTEEQVPVIAKAAGIKFAGSGDVDTGVYTVSITYSSADAAGAAKTSYEEALVAKSFAETEAGSGIYRNASLALQVEVSVAEAVLTIKFSSITKDAWDVADVNLALDLEFTSSDLPNLTIKSNVSSGFSKFEQTDVYYYYIESSYEGISALWTEVYYAFRNSSRWAYEGSDSYDYDWFYNKANPWLEVRIRPALVDSHYYVVVEFIVDENARALSEFLGYRYYSSCIPYISGGFQFVPSSQSEGTVYFGGYTDQTEGEDPQTGLAQAQAAAGAYITALASDDYGFEYNSTTNEFFDGSVYVSVSITYQTIQEVNYYYVVLSLRLATPQEQIEFFLKNLLSEEDYKDAIPELPFASGTLSDMAGGSDYGSIEFTFESEQAASDAAAAYITALTSTGEDGYNFVLVPAEDDDPAHYELERADGTILAYVSASGSKVTFTIVFVAKVQFADVVSALNELFAAEDYSTIIGSLSFLESNFTTAQFSANLDGDVYVTCTYDTEDDAKAALATLVANLLAKEIEAVDMTEGELGTYFNAYVEIGNKVYFLEFGCIGGSAQFYFADITGLSA